MDWTGQMHAEWVYQIIISLFTLVGFVYAYAEQDFTYCVHGWLAGLLLSSVVVLPDLPWFNKHPIKWLDECPEEWSTREYDEDGMIVRTPAGTKDAGHEKLREKKKKKKKGSKSH